VLKRDEGLGPWALHGTAALPKIVTTVRIMLARIAGDEFVFEVDFGTVEPTDLIGVRVPKGFVSGIPAAAVGAGCVTDESLAGGDRLRVL
jgi:hypothetical protein